MIRHQPCYPWGAPAPGPRPGDGETGETTMCTWEVLPAESGSPIIASGITTDAAKARLDVEVAMSSPGAGFAHLVRTSIPGMRPALDDRRAWPPLGEVQLCRRDRNGGFAWRALHGFPEEAAAG
jgi:hypothetical protein